MSLCIHIILNFDMIRYISSLKVCQRLVRRGAPALNAMTTTTTPKVTKKNNDGAKAKKTTARKRRWTPMCSPTRARLAPVLPVCRRGKSRAGRRRKPAVGEVQQEDEVAAVRQAAPPAAVGVAVGNSIDSSGAYCIILYSYLCSYLCRRWYAIKP